MTVVGLQDFLSAAIARQTKPVSFRAPVVSQPNTPTAPAQSASLSSIPAQSVSTASFTSTSANLAQLGSVLQVTARGADQVQALLQQLASLAGQASAGGVSSATLAKIDSQFQQLLAQINRVAAGTTFEGASVLDGSGQQVSVNSGDASAPQQNAPKVTLPTITLQSLFGSQQPNLLTPEAAAQAVKLVSNAKSSLDTITSDLKDAQSQVEYTSATVQTALTNIDASKAVLSEADAAGLFENLLGGLLDSPVAAAQLQGGNLSPSLLSLLQE